MLLWVSSVKLRVLRGKNSFFLIAHIRFFSLNVLLVSKQQRKCGSGSPAQNFIAQRKAAWRGHLTTPGGLTKTAKRFWFAQGIEAEIPQTPPAI
jgi:hypothetical protein